MGLFGRVARAIPPEDNEGAVPSFYVFRRLVEEAAEEEVRQCSCMGRRQRQPCHQSRTCCIQLGVHFCTAECRKRRSPSVGRLPSAPAR